MGERERERRERGERKRWSRDRKGVERERRSERKTDRVVPFAANEYLINLLAWMYLIPRRRGGTRTSKGLR